MTSFETGLALCFAALVLAINVIGVDLASHAKDFDHLRGGGVVSSSDCGIGFCAE